MYLNNIVFYGIETGFHFLDVRMEAYVTTALSPPCILKVLHFNMSMILWRGMAPWYFPEQIVEFLK